MRCRTATPTVIRKERLNPKTAIPIAVRGSRTVVTEIRTAAGESPTGAVD